MLITNETDDWFLESYQEDDFAISWMIDDMTNDNLIERVAKYAKVGDVICGINLLIDGLKMVDLQHTTLEIMEGHVKVYYEIPLSITELFDDPISYWRDFIDYNQACYDTSYPFIQSMCLSTTKHKKLIEYIMKKPISDDYYYTLEFTDEQMLFEVSKKNQHDMNCYVYKK